MSEIEKMQKYIDRTNLRKNDRFNMDMAEAFALANQVYSNTALSLDIICMAFQYGKAKGYRAAKAEVRK